MPNRRAELLAIFAEKGLPGPSIQVMECLRDIIDEGVLGASNHVALALPLVAEVAEADRGTALEEALTLADFIAETRGQGAPIVANALRWQTAGVAADGDMSAVDLLRARAQRWYLEAKARRNDLVARAEEALSACRVPLIHDYSSTVVEIVRGLKWHLDRIIISESRAIDGGRRYTQALADLGVEILFVPDAALDWAVGQADAVLLGAESVTLDGGVSNTIGSISAARAGVARGVPVYGAADLFKVGPKRAEDLPPPALRDYPDLLRDGETMVTQAPELEIVPPALIQAILTEEGPIAPDDLARAVEGRGR